MEENDYYNGDVATVKDAEDGKFIAQPYIIKEEHKHRIISFDETHWMLGDDVKKKPIGVAMIHGNENAYIDTNVSTTKSSKSATLVGGSNASGQSLPMMAIFPDGTFDMTWTVGAPESMILDSNGKRLKAVFAANAKGGMTNDMSLVYLNKILIPSCPGVSPTNKYIIICDGHGSHLTAAFVQRCRELGFTLILRIPHTTDKTQGEDVVNFGVFKSAEARAKGLLRAQRSIHQNTLNLARVEITMADAMLIIKPAWEKAFGRKLNLLGWQKTGYSPFTMLPVLDVTRKYFHRKEKLGVGICWSEKRLIEVVPEPVLPHTLPELDEMISTTRVSAGMIATNGAATSDELMALILEKDRLVKEKALEKSDRAAQRDETNNARRQRGYRVSIELLHGKTTLDSVTGERLKDLASYANLKIRKQDNGKPPTVQMLRTQLQTEVPECITARDGPVPPLPELNAGQPVTGVADTDGDGAGPADGSPTDTTIDED